MTLLLHSETSTVAPLQFGNKQVISSYDLQRIWLLIHAMIKVNLRKRGRLHSCCIYRYVFVTPWYIITNLEIFYSKLFPRQLILGYYGNISLFLKSRTLEYIWCIVSNIRFILGMGSASKRRRHNVMSLIGWGHTQNDPWFIYTYVC